jgi:hypothetical protein
MAGSAEEKEFVLTGQRHTDTVFLLVKPSTKLEQS